MIAYLWVFLACAGTTFLATPLVRGLVVRVGAVDRPSDRKVHPRATPTMGGLAMYLGVLAGLGLSRLLPFFAPMNRGSSEPVAALLTCTLIVALGAVDDLRGISVLTKLTGQVFIAGVLILAGVQLEYLFFPETGIGIVSIGSDLAVPATIAWVVVIVNAVNLVDGLDGLAAGMVTIAASSFFVFMVRTPTVLFNGASSAALLSAVTAGVCLGFLPWNWHPARIFMGDTGAMLLGMLLAIATLSGVARNPFPPGGGDFAVIVIPVLIPLLVLAIPFLDVVLAVVRRTRGGLGIGHADKGHLHHRLLDIGHGYRQAVLLMYLWSALISVAGLAVGFIDGRLAAGAVILVAFALFLVTALPRLASRRRVAGAPATSGGHEPQPAASREAEGERI